VLPGRRVRKTIGLMLQGTSELNGHNEE
jgi:hypothetical protein